MLRRSVSKWAKKINPLKRLRLWVKQKFGLLGIPVIIPYRGYGSRQYAYVSGSVSEDKGLEKPSVDHSGWENMKSMIKRYISDDIPGARVRAIFMGQEMIAVTNDRGIFHFKFNLSGIVIPDENWQEVEFELLDQIIDRQQKITATGEILILKENKNRFGIISDIDDTILVSHATNFIKKLRLMLFKNAVTRLPFEGVSAFYAALHSGTKGTEHNPIFFISSSEWNLYDLLIDFCKFRKIPKGPFLLQDLKPIRKQFPFRGKTDVGKHINKVTNIKHILDTFHYLNFILIGDSGQKDAEIYRKITMKYPGRILVIYIRDIKKSRTKKVTIIGRELDREGVEMLLIKDTVLAAKHAIKNNFIKKEALKEVIYEKNKDLDSAIEI